MRTSVPIRSPLVIDAASSLRAFARRTRARMENSSAGKSWLDRPTETPAVKASLAVDLPAKQVREDAMLFQDREQFAGHDGPERIDLAPSQGHPLVVRAGMADEGVGIDQSIGDAAEQLHFLAAHDIGMHAFLIGQARHDRIALPRPREIARKVVDTGRARYIGGIDPATAGARHSGHQQGQIAKPLPNLGGRGRE